MFTFIAICQIANLCRTAVSGLQGLLWYYYSHNANDLFYLWKNYLLYFSLHVDYACNKIHLWSTNQKNTVGIIDLWFHIKDEASGSHQTWSKASSVSHVMFSSVFKLTALNRLDLQQIYKKADGLKTKQGSLWICLSPVCLLHSPFTANSFIYPPLFRQAGVSRGSSGCEQAGRHANLCLTLQVCEGKKLSTARFPVIATNH